MDFSSRGCKNFLAWLWQKLHDVVQFSSRVKIQDIGMHHTLASRQYQKV